MDDPSITQFRSGVEGGRVWIYALVDPRDNTVRYVGKTTNVSRRLKQHIESTQGSSGMRSWRRELSDAGVVMEIHKLSQESEETWADAERAWIGFFRARGEIYNIRAGGEAGGNPSLSRSVVGTITPARLTALAKAARAAGIISLTIPGDGGVSFTIGDLPATESYSYPSVAVDARPDTGSLEGLRRRFERRQA